jgi:hypothetical protein
LGAITGVQLHAAPFTVDRENQGKERQTAGRELLPGDDFGVGEARRGGEAARGLIPGDGGRLPQSEPAEVLIARHDDEFSHVNEIKVVPREAVKKGFGESGGHITGERT